MKKSGISLLVTLVLILSVTMGCFLSSNASASMQFSQPVEIGHVGTKGGPLQDKYYDFNSKAGIVRLHVSPNASFGSPEDSKNTVSLRRYSRFTIYETTGSSGLPVFVILDGGTDGGFGVTIVGKNKNGQYVKYIDADRLDNILKQWFPYAGYVSFVEFSPMSPMGKKIGNSPEILVDGNTILLKCAIMVSGGSQAGYKLCQFSFKWDDAAEWFGIDYKLLD